MSASIAAARACARTIIFDCLRINAFKGAIPHVMLVLDKVPCVQQKVLVEGYMQELDAFNGKCVQEAYDRASGGGLFIPMAPDATTPCGASGLSASSSSSSTTVGSDQAASSITYSVLPFVSERFAADMKSLQVFLRHCGSAKEADGISSEQFEKQLDNVRPYVQPLQGSSSGSCNITAADLHSGPRRELLGFILIQRNAFQNELQQYRLRLQLFDMGMRVAEHCHLECMSVPADALAAEGKYADALAQDEVYTYARSCAFPPAVAECLARGIADSIDLHSWNRGGEAAAADAAPPAFSRLMQSEALWSLMKTGAITWAGAEGAAASPDTYDATLQQPIHGAGTPLQIVSRDADHTLTFAGGMEDCLMNTGYYRAAEEADRNDVAAHRLRFPAEDAAKKSDNDGEVAEAAAAVPEPVHGRLKKKEYLALLKQKGQKPNKRAHDSDDDEAAMNSAPRPLAGSCMSASIGGTFPIGEVISESFDLSQLNGSCQVFAYPDSFKQVAMSKPAPFVLCIEKGIVTRVSDGAPSDFLDLLSLVRQTEGNCYVRELGIGLNPYTGRAHVLSDVTSFERQWGVHLSLGQRHPLFVKQRAKKNADGTVAESVQVEGPVLKRKAGKFHIDVFVDAATLRMGPLEVDFTKGLKVV